MNKLMWFRFFGNRNEIRLFYNGIEYLINKYEPNTVTKYYCSYDIVKRNNNFGEDLYEEAPDQLKILYDKLNSKLYQELLK